MEKQSKKESFYNTMGSIGKADFKKSLLAVCIGATFSNIIFISALAYSKSIGIWEPYILSMIALVGVNAFFSLKFSTLVSKRLRNASPRYTGLKSILLPFLALFPWLGIFFIYLLATKDTLSKGELRKKALAFLMLSTVLFSTYRFSQEKEGTIKKEPWNLIKDVYALTYDNSFLSFRYVLRIAKEASEIFNFDDCKLPEEINPKIYTPDWSCFTDAMENFSKENVKKSQTFYVLAVAKDAQRLFTLKNEFGKYMDTPRRKSFHLQYVALTLVESQIRYFNMTQQTSSPLDLSFPYLIYLPGNIEGALLYAVESSVQHRFEKVQNEKMTMIIDSVLKNLTDSTDLTEDEKKRLLARAERARKRLDQTKDKSFLKMRWALK